MFAKIFSQIFDSSIAENYEARHVFMDLLVLADSDGCVDMTAGAISRRTNVPFAVVERALMDLAAPDAATRTPDEDGRRIIPLEEGRAWGWKIVNYQHYRAIRDEEMRREYHRTYKQKVRAEAKKAKKPKQYHRANGSQTPQSGPAATEDEVNRALRLSEEPPVLNGAGI